MNSEPVRVMLYGLLGPLVAVLVVYGLIDSQQAVVWSALATAVFGAVGTEVARSNVTPVNKHEG